mgnify:CR=1 FL=1
MRSTPTLEGENEKSKDLLEAIAEECEEAEQEEQDNRLRAQDSELPPPPTNATTTVAADNTEVAAAAEGDTVVLPPVPPTGQTFPFFPTPPKQLPYDNT